MIPISRTDNDDEIEYSLENSRTLIANWINAEHHSRSEKKSDAYNNRSVEQNNTTLKRIGNTLSGKPLVVEKL